MALQVKTADGINVMPGMSSGLDRVGMHFSGRAGSPQGAAATTNSPLTYYSVAAEREACRFRDRALAKAGAGSKLRSRSCGQPSIWSMYTRAEFIQGAVKRVDDADLRTRLNARTLSKPRPCLV
jgi:hypothetical protein